MCRTLTTMVQTEDGCLCVWVEIVLYLGYLTLDSLSFFVPSENYYIPKVV